MAPKKKQEKMSIGAFLNDETLGKTNWADEMDDMPLPASSGFGSERREYSKPSYGSGFGSSGGDMGGERNYATREQLPFPTKPPYTAHLGNLSYDVNRSEIEEFFSACSVTSVRIVEDKIEQKPKGFGYVEFGSLEGLKKAVDLNGTQFQGRNVRISVAEAPKEGRGEAREITDWSRKGPLAPLPETQRRPSERGSFRPADSGSDFGMGERGGSRRGGGSQFGGEGDGKSRDFSNWERKGPMSPSMGAPPRVEGGAADDVRRNDRSFERRGSPASWGAGREPGAFQAPRPERTERPAIPERTPTAADQDSKWREKMRPDAPSPSATPTPDASVPSSPAPPSAPASRPRLNLAKRTVSEAPKDGEATPSSDSKASPFGAARPIDTTARDKEIEEKRVAARQRKEEEDKALAEKKAAEKTEKLANMTREPREPKEAKAANVNGNSKQSKPAQGGPEDLDTSAKPRNFQILQRMDGNEDGSAPTDGETGDATMNGNTAEAQSMKPEPVVADAPAREGNDAAQALEEDGWEVAEKKTKKKSAPRANNRS